MPAKRTKTAKRRVAVSQPSGKLESENQRARTEALERIASAIDRLTEAIREGNRMRRRPVPFSE